MYWECLWHTDGMHISSSLEYLQKVQMFPYSVSLMVQMFPFALHSSSSLGQVFEFLLYLPH